MNCSLVFLLRSRAWMSLPETLRSVSSVFRERSRPVRRLLPMASSIRAVLFDKSMLGIWLVDRFKSTSSVFLDRSIDAILLFCA